MASRPPRGSGRPRSAAPRRWRAPSPRRRSPPSPPARRAGRGGRRAGPGPPRPSWLLGEEAVDVSPEGLVVERADVLRADAAGPVDEEGLRHAVDAVVHRDATAGVGSVGEGVAELGEEALGALLLVLDVHADEGHALVLVGLPAALERGGFLVARGKAPRRPEVQHHHAAAQRLEREVAAVEGREDERGGARADQRRRDLPWVRLEAV